MSRSISGRTFIVVVSMWIGAGTSSAIAQRDDGAVLTPEGTAPARALVEEAVYTELENSPDARAYVFVVLRPVGRLAPARLADHQTAVRQRQDAVLARLAPGRFTPVYRYSNLAVMTGYVDAEGLARLAADPDVLRIGPDARVRATLAESVPFINADQVRDQYCYTGQGITVAVLDTGIDTDHPDMIDDVAPGGWYFLSEGADTGPGAEDDNGHGTNVSGIITSAGAIAPPGVAPDADILAVKVLDTNGEGWVSDWVAGVNYVVSVQANYNRLAVINMSLGTFALFSNCPCDDDTAYNEAAQEALQAAKAAGIVTFASSGNRGWCDRMSSPACLSAATAVAAVYDLDYGREPDSGTYWDAYGDSFGDCFDDPTFPDLITCFSNRSPCNELAAPGRWITAPGMGGGTSTYTGTSQAAPHCSGVAALLLQADPARQLTPNDIVQLLKQTGQPTVDPCETTPNPLRVDALAAVDVLVNSWAEVARVLPPDGAPFDFLGMSVGISGDAGVVGVPYDDDNAENAGSAYVLRYDGSNWVQEAKLLSSDGAPNRFGYAVAISGDTAVIGADFDSENGAFAGAAYVFRYDGSSWVQEAKVMASDGGIYDYLGASVAISGDAAVIGAPEDDDNGENSGSAYIFRFDGSGWVQEAKLLASDGAAYDDFGTSVAISGNTVVIGAFLDDDNGFNAGSAYVFRFDGSGWVQEPKLLASDGGAEDFFGLSVGLSNDAALIGAPWNNDFGTHSGSAYVFRFDGSSWAEEQKLLASDGATGNEFGWSVSISGYAAVIGAPSHDDNGPLSGSAYTFAHNGSNWVEQAELLASDGAAGDHFGESVSISAGNALIGAIYDDDNGSNSGSAYVFSNPAIEDCNANGIPDACDIASGTSSDNNDDGIPDECGCAGDLDGDGDVDLSDLAQLLTNYGMTSGATYEDGDLDGDGDVDLTDLAALLSVYGATCG
ncbi:MAG: S8 family serine peptidase [Phycisphaerae bacterium]